MGRDLAPGATEVGATFRSAEEFNAIMRNRDLLEAIVALRQKGVNDWQIASTPSFVVNNDEVLSGNMSYEDFAEGLSAFGA